MGLDGSCFSGSIADLRFLSGVTFTAAHVREGLAALCVQMKAIDSAIGKEPLADVAAAEEAKASARDGPRNKNIWEARPPV